MQENLVPKFARYFAIPPKLSWKAVRSFEINWFKWTCKVFEWLKKVPVFCHGFTNYIAVDPRWTSAIIKATFYLSTNYPKIKKGAATVMHKNTHALTHTHTQTTWKYCHLLKEINFDTLQFLGQRWVPRINFKHISPKLDNITRLVLHSTNFGDNRLLKVPKSSSRMLDFLLQSFLRHWVLQHYFSISNDIIKM